MNFTIVEVSDNKKLTKLTKKSFLFGNHEKNEHLSIIHNFKMKNDISHLVYHLKDEYCISTIAMGDQFKIPYSSLINLFYTKKSKFVFLENLNTQTDQLIIDELINKTKDDVVKKNICNTELINVFREFNPQIIKINYIDEFEDYEEKSYTSEIDFLKIAQNINNKIEYITFSIEDKLMSMYETGKVTINNEDEKYLINVVERLYSCLEE